MWAWASGNVRHVILRFNSSELWRPGASPDVTWRDRYVPWEWTSQHFTAGRLNLSTCDYSSDRNKIPKKGEFSTPIIRPKQRFCQRRSTGSFVIFNRIFILTNWMIVGSSGWPGFRRWKSWVQWWMPASSCVSVTTGSKSEEKKLSLFWFWGQGNSPWTIMQLIELLAHRE